MMSTTTAIVPSSSPNGNEMPDADAIKMFIGQIPKSWNENDVRIYFEQYGPIYMVNVLRDKVTKHSRGTKYIKIHKSHNAPDKIAWSLYTSFCLYVFTTGCCFITYFTRKAALEAQNACHNLKTLPGVH